MTELDQELADLQQDAVTCAENLLRLYSFEVGGYTADQLLSRWLESHTAEWVRLAIVEALYQGRYKSVSVEQILAFWRRRGSPLPHFNHEFDRMVCSKFPRAMPPSRLGSMKLFKPVFPNLDERSSFQTSQSKPNSVTTAATLAALRQGPATMPEHAARFLVASASTSSDASEPGTPERNSSSRVLPSESLLNPSLLDPALKRSLQLFPERRSPSSAVPNSTLQLPMFPMMRSPKSPPDSQLENFVERDRPPDNVVPLPVRPTSPSIPSSQVGSYDLRTESGRQEFMQTMLGMLSRQDNLSQQNTLPTALRLLADPQTLDVAAWTADSPAAEQEPPGTLRFLSSALDPTELTDTVWIQDVQTQDVQAQDVQAQDVEVQDIQTAQTPNSLEVSQSVGEHPLPTSFASSADSGVIHQFTPRTTSSPFYAKLKAALPLSGLAGANVIPDRPTIADDDEAAMMISRFPLQSLESNQPNPLDTLDGLD